METVGVDDIESPTIIAVSFVCAVDKRKSLIRWWITEILGRSWSEDLSISNSCGGETVYRTADDIPLVDVPCPCGDPNHWLIKWTDL